MVQYNFKRITVVPTAKDFVDIVLSRTQRQTPTVIHKQYAISRIRQFYMRKVKFTQTNYNEKLTTILEDFPRVEDVHPFYGDLLNVLYDKDHYKLALGQLNTARNLIDKLAKEYVRLLKYGDTLYRCKQLKRAALGRMCTLMLKQGPSLAYLEQVRQHMSRLPSIDPNTRTILVCGYPNVGKSSFMNKVTRADVEVQPYAFTTKSLFVGHTDYKYLRWQVIDTPGILDHPLEDRNTIEMLSITAMAHLRAAVLFVVDLSGSCGYTIAQQAALFDSIKPLFSNKPLIVACNKVDLAPLESLAAEDRALLEEMGREAAKCGAMAMGLLGGGGGDDSATVAQRAQDSLMTMSTLTEEGVVAVKNTACELLLQARVETKMKGKKISDVLNRIHVAMPRARDTKERPPCIPDAVLEARANKGAAAKLGDGRKTEKDLENENGGAGVYSANLHKHYLLGDDSWKDDVIPEIVDGHNVADFVDPDIMLRLEELEREEEAREGEEEDDDVNSMSDDVEDLTPEEQQALAAIRKKKAEMVQVHRRKKSLADNNPVLPRKFDREGKFTVDRMQKHLTEMGIDPSAAVARARSRSVSRRGRKRDRSQAPMDVDSGDDGENGGAGDAMEVDGGHAKKRRKLRSVSRSRGPLEIKALPGDGFKDTPQKIKAFKLERKAQKKRNKDARIGEGDRRIFDLRPKHLLSGKRSTGKTDRR
ncbi:hypothetical protein CBR_g77869 [Chara braunii]|uniref:Nucleolar GTP-binding protein 1 n=1 Tax=Chara braunii TaxID=69332 RepID=A0A388JK87_CHABU|nr:hypothetical protein CBR_g77869 [Chara braunii]|eukprot:GBG44384.1 hypothetical protein CBR_g77869 [Chara braunii]